jgi:hypothetical protein
LLGGLGLRGGPLLLCCRLLRRPLLRCALLGGLGLRGSLLLCCCLLRRPLLRCALLGGLGLRGPLLLCCCLLRRPLLRCPSALLFIGLGVGDVGAVNGSELQHHEAQRRLRRKSTSRTQ